MAGTTRPETTHEASDDRIQQLRAMAQSNLDTIEAEDLAEATQQEVVARDLQKYAKAKRKDRVRSTATTTDAHPPPPPETKGARFRSAQDVLDRIRHDPGLNLAEYRVGYLERFEGIKEMPVRSWIRESTDEDWIPQHRIKYVKRVDAQGQGEIVWDREARIDKVFGSHGGAGEGREDEESEFGGVTIS